ncbi:MAG: hypothetical protein OHK0046_43590 [Anaerolineae bacterium]
MSTTIKEWLVKQLNGLVSVQRAVVGGEADVTVFMWSGVRVRVHLVDESFKIRNLKRVLQDATDIGVGSMFLVDAHLLPKDGQRIEVPDWLMALHILNHERVYAYRLSKDSAELIQIHFETVVGSTEMKTWHGAKVEFEKLRFFRTSQKHRLIKGDWLIADFGSAAFWKTHEYRTYRTKADEQSRAHRQTHWQDWSGYQTWSGNYERTRPNGNGSAEHASMHSIGDYLETCYKILGIESSSTREDAKRAFRKLALTVHPDTSTLPPAEAEEKFRTLNAAYEYIKAAKGWS